MVGRGGNLDHRSMVGRGSNLDHRSVVSRCSNNRGMIGRSSNNRSFVSRSSMVDRGRVIDRSRGMVNWGLYNRSVVGWGSNNRGFVSRSSMVGRSRVVHRGRGISGLHREGSRGMDSSGGFLEGAIAMYRLWASMGLADHRGMYSAMGLVDRVAD